MDARKIHVGDVGTVFRTTLLGCTSPADGTRPVIDVSGATVLTMKFSRPATDTLAADVVTRTATLYTDGTDGVIQYVTADGDLDRPGSWKMQGHVEWTGPRKSGDIEKFKVYPNLTPAG